jgi:hypothetical protein
MLHQLNPISSGVGRQWPSPIRKGLRSQSYYVRRFPWRDACIRAADDKASLKIALGVPRRVHTRSGELSPERRPPRQRAPSSCSIELGTYSPSNPKSVIRRLALSQTAVIRVSRTWTPMTGTAKLARANQCRIPANDIPNQPALLRGALHPSWRPSHGSGRPFAARRSSSMPNGLSRHPPDPTSSRARRAITLV